MYKLKFISQKKTIYEEQNYCIDFKMGTLWTKNCAKASCVKTNQSLQQLKKKINQGQGSQSFHVCHRLNADPQIIQVLHPKLKKWRTFDRCRFKDAVVDSSSVVFKLKQK